MQNAGLVQEVVELLVEVPLVLVRLLLRLEVSRRDGWSISLSDTTFLGGYDQIWTLEIREKTKRNRVTMMPQ